VLPPGPRSGLLSTLRYVRAPSEYLAQQRARFGEAFTVRGANGNLVMTLSPALAKAVFTADADTLEVFGGEAVSGMLGERSLLVEDGELHRRDRKLLAPPFQGQRMRAYGETMRDAARARSEHLRPGDRFVAYQLTSRIALDVILRTVFGVRDRDALRSADAVLAHLLASLDPLLFFAKQTHTPLYPPYRRFRAAHARYTAWAMPRIAARRREPPGDDVLGTMIAARYDDGSQLDDRAIHDQLLTLLLAGHETTAIALAWALREVALRRDVRDRVRAELATLGPDRDADAIARLPYLGAICDETIRLHTIVTDVVRQMRVPTQIGRWSIPAGWAVAVGIVAIHEDPAVHPEPKVFRPERFLGKKKPSPFEFLAFGGGHRRCLGAAFSDHEMRVVLATLIERFDFALAGDRPERTVRRNITMGPESGVVLRVVDRHR
jgi:cytochrome P450